MNWIKRRVVGYLINSADSLELSGMAKMIVGRYAELFADEEVVFLSLPKRDAEERRRILHSVLEMDQDAVRK